MLLIQKTFKNNLPILYVVGTPIGNLADFSFRAVETLKSVDYILCEDTRTSQVLLTRYQITKPLISLHKYNELERSALIADHLKSGHNLALISDAGVPLISDPGAWLLTNLRDEKQVPFNISAVNCGPAYIHALCVGALVGKSNYFHGFLVAKNQQAKEAELRTIVFEHPNTVVSFYESVHRIQATIATLTKILPTTGSTKVVLARELTKLNEEIIIGSIAEVNAFVQSSEFILKGEFVVCFANEKLLKVFSKTEQIKLIQVQLDQGLKLKTATHNVSAQTGINSNELYELFLKESGKKD